MRNFSLPVQREAAYIKMEYSELMLDMFQQHIEEERNKQLQEQRKGSVLRVSRLRVLGSHAGHVPTTHRGGEKQTTAGAEERLRAQGK